MIIERAITEAGALLDGRHSAVREGRVHAVRGNVVDVYFTDGVPARYSALEIAGPERVRLEVESHVGQGVVRCIALSPTRGLARGDRVIDTGGVLQIPVGPALLGRMLNVFGEPIDRGVALADVV